MPPELLIVRMLHDVGDATEGEVDPPEGEVDPGEDDVGAGDDPLVTTGDVAVGELVDVEVSVGMELDPPVPEPAVGATATGASPT